jgi:hypothetical protein
MFEDGVFNRKEYQGVLEKAKSFAPQAIKVLEMNPEYYFEPLPKEFSGLSISAKAHIVDTHEYLYYG